MNFRKLAILVFSGAMFVSLSSFCEQLKVWNNTNSYIVVTAYYIDNNLENRILGPTLFLEEGKTAATNIDVTKGARIDLDVSYSLGAAVKDFIRDFPIVKGSDIEVVWNGKNITEKNAAPTRSRTGAVTLPKKEAGLPGGDSTILR